MRPELNTKSPSIATGSPIVASASRRRRLTSFAAILFSAIGTFSAQSTSARQIQPAMPDSTHALRLDLGVDNFVAANLGLSLVRSSQTAAGLHTPASASSNPTHDRADSTDSTSSFDFTPGDWLDKRQANGFFHLGDINIRYRSSSSEPWIAISTASNRAPVTALPASGDVLAAAELSASLPSDIPLRIRRYWENNNGALALRFELTNTGTTPVEIGALGMPMVFNNILSDRSLEEAHAVNVFYDPYVGLDAGYLQVTRLNGAGPALVVVPMEGTPFEAYNPLRSDPTRTGVTFEGFYEWMAHTLAYKDGSDEANPNEADRRGAEWRDADPWNPPTSATLQSGASRSYGVRFLVADSIRGIEQTLISDGRPVAVGVPGYVVPMDLDAQLFVKSAATVASIAVEPEGSLSVFYDGERTNGWSAYTVRGNTWGRSRLTIDYADGTKQTVHYKVIKSQSDLVADVGSFLTNEQWFDDPDDPFGRDPSVISYDYYNKRQVTQDNRAWIAGLGDEGGSGSWLAAFMKQLVQPNADEIRKLERFVDSTLWGGLQYSDGDLKYGVRKSLFYYEPDRMPAGTYADSIRYGGWSSWNEEHARTVGRSYNYPHVAAAYWVFYHIARNYDGLVTNHDWRWYLEQAYHTSEAMVALAPDYAQFGQMEGSIFLMILRDLQREGMMSEATALEKTMRARADVWDALDYPFGSEMPWDSTGQEEVYGWCTYFGFDDKALVTLNAILGYMPTVPHWGYNGSARRYWDFWYAGHPKYSRLERQLHHYGSGLNAIPVLTEYRKRPDDFYLLRVGYGGLMGSIANVTQDGFGPSGFHSYPSTLEIDGYSGDYGPNFFGHAVNTGTYLTHHPEFGWLAFGGSVSEIGGAVVLHPRDAARRRVFIAPEGLWLTIESGAFESVSYDTATGDITIALAPATDAVSQVLLRVERTNAASGTAGYAPVATLASERGGFVVPLGEPGAVVMLRRGDGR